MDPKFNGEWSASDIRMVKSLIASHDANNNYANDTNKTHNAIVNELQAWFPQKEKSQVIELYVDLLVEMMLQAQSGNHSVVAISNLVNDNSGIPMEDPPMKNMDMLLASYLKDKTPEAMGMVEEAPQRQVIVPRQKRQHNEGSWTIEEHRQFLCGLHEYGRGNWKNICRDFVTTRTPAQVSSHAQKYFIKMNCTSEKKRYSINDVGLYNAEPWAHNNSFSQDPPAFGDAHNPNCYGSSNQIVPMNNVAPVWSPFLYSAGQASSSQVSTLAGQQLGASSSPALALEGVGSQMALTGNQQGDFLPEQWMDIDNM